MPGDKWDTWFLDRASLRSNEYIHSRVRRTGRLDRPRRLVCTHVYATLPRRNSGAIEDEDDAGPRELPYRTKCSRDDLKLQRVWRRYDFRMYDIIGYRRRSLGSK